MDVQPDIDLISMFDEVLIVQNNIHKLDLMEAILSEISDFVDDQALPQPIAQLQVIHQQIGQVKVQLRFLLQLKLLEACRRLRQHLNVHGRLPLLNLQFR